MNATQVNASWCDWYMWLFTISLGCHNHCSYMFFHWNFGKFGLLNLPPPSASRPRDVRTWMRTSAQSSMYLLHLAHRWSHVAYRGEAVSTKNIKKKTLKISTQIQNSKNKIHKRTIWLKAHIKQKRFTNSLPFTEIIYDIVYELSDFIQEFVCHSSMCNLFTSFFLLFTNFITRP